ncbi:cytochrome-c oxidase, cbb3-type subunit II [Rhodanobacter sp. B05]|jgi:cytochrome c oxidase cbb3-type subunit 2|uniref:cytochrome-c oxidase, cbb3-type subunit II n=1 Tax=Rhodanobacter sp. B05 TaxID=1945859 RepID=UPI0009866DC0|nr:cytochrome-c oxidase, cbb3-type subunit II [Rhodanobacter sp. B05]OOG55890.1 cytochrome-c oxidase, cbb3-type subunit II [Rhodanobacter sp. B05]
MAYKHFEAIEKHAGLLGVLIAIMVSLGGLAEITPLFMEAHSVKPPPGVQPYDALRLMGRDVYVENGCYLCHSQMIRALRFETERYGHYSTAAESVYDRPFQWGSKRTGPDLARVGGKYSDEWQRLHLMAPRQLVPQSNMPGYPWLAQNKLDGADVQARMRTLRRLGDPYTDAQIAAAPAAVAGKTEMDALIAYLQGLGIDNEPRPPVGGAAAAGAAPASDGGTP